jgi:pimeloyl-ACP methyl ester carboxylesterase
VNSGRPVPVWFGPDESPLFGVLHIPEAPTRGAIVLCPPLGREYVYSHSTFVKLATDLARLGLAAFRFDYRSTGDSFDRVADDLNRGGFGHDVRLAVEFVRTLGVAHVGIVGMRLGANFAGLQRGCEPVDAMVMWDPCPTGRSFLREQRALGLFGGVLTAEDANTIDLPGFELSSEMSKEISALDLTEGQLGPVAAGGLADRVLLLTRSERSADRKIVEGFDLAHVEHREVPGQPLLLDVHDDWPVVPTEGLATVSEWLDKVMAHGGSTIVVPTQSEVVVRTASGGSSSGEVPTGGTVLIRERSVRLGPEGLFGIETEGDATSRSPVCIFVSVANEHRVGPGRLWVQLSRSLAAEGFRCVRYDVTGFGDSPPRAGVSLQSMHSLDAIDDVLEVARAVSPEVPREVVLFGLCSSGYQVLEASLRLSPRGVCAMNPSVLFRPAEMASGGSMDPRRRFCVPEDLTLAGARESRAGRWLKRRFPKPVTRLSGRLWSVVGFFRDGLGARLGDLVRAGTEVLLIGNEHEVQPFMESGVSAVRRPEQKARLQIEVIHTLNHGLVPSRDRQQVTELVLDFVLTRFRRPPEAEPSRQPLG